ncbi:MAG: cell division protein FtsQ/DivIB [Vicinamibacterales bacterium]
MRAVAAATDKRFRRAHVKPARKGGLPLRRVRGVIRVLVILTLLAAGGWSATRLVLTAPALQVSHLTIRGNERLSTGEILALVDELRGQNILTVQLGEWRERVLTSQWVEDAAIRRVLPSTLEITVRERRPMGIGRLGTTLYLVDPHGVIVDEYGPNYADIDLPIIDGLSAPPPRAAGLIDAARAAFAARVLSALTAKPDLVKRVSQLDVSDVHNAVVILDGDTALLRLGENDFAERLQQYLDLAPALRARVAAIDYVDLRFDERLYVRPAGRPSSAPARK